MTTTRFQATSYTSKADSTGNGGGIVYVEVSHADVAELLFTSGARAVMLAAGLTNNVNPADVLYGRGRYGGDTYVRVKRDVYEGRAAARAPSAGRVTAPYVPGGGRVNTPTQPAARPGVSLTDLAAQVAALTAALTAAQVAAPAPVTMAAKGKAVRAMTKA